MTILWNHCCELLGSKSVEIMNTSRQPSQGCAKVQSVSVVSLRSVVFVKCKNVFRESKNEVRLFFPERTDGRVKISTQANCERPQETSVNNWRIEMVYCHRESGICCECLKMCACVQRECLYFSLIGLYALWWRAAETVVPASKPSPTTSLNDILPKLQTSPNIDIVNCN